MNSWNLLFKHVFPMAKPFLPRAYLKGLNRLNLDEGAPPNPAQLADMVNKTTGWELVKAEGEVDRESFFRLLTSKRFPLVHELRAEHSLFSSANPDLWHEVVGHLPFLFDPVMSELYQEIGRRAVAAIGSGDHTTLDNATKSYWYLCEYGLVLEDGDLKMIGAGLIASPVGTFKVRKLAQSMKIQPYAAQDLASTAFDPYRFQNLLYFLSDYSNLRGIRF